MLLNAMGFRPIPHFDLFNPIIQLLIEFSREFFGLLRISVTTTLFELVTLVTGLIPHMPFHFIFILISEQKKWDCWLRVCKRQKCLEHKAFVMHLTIDYHEYIAHFSYFYIFRKMFTNLNFQLFFHYTQHCFYHSRSQRFILQCSETWNKQSSFFLSAILLCFSYYSHLINYLR